MEYEKIEEILSKLKKEIACLNNNSCNLYGLVKKIENKQFVSYSMWCLEFLAKNIHGIHSCCSFIERLIKDMNKETNNG